MTLQKLAPAPVARYVTVQDAVERIGVAERTLRRWIEETDEKKKKFHRILRDPSGFVRLDLEEVEQIVRARGGVVPSVHQQIERLLERIEALESEKQPRHSNTKNCWTGEGYPADCDDHRCIVPFLANG